MKLKTVVAVTKYADKTRCSDKITIIVSDIKTDSELCSCVSDLSMCREMNMMNIKTEKKSKIILF